MSEELYSCQLEIVDLVSTIEDTLIWQFSSKGTYSSQSLYRIINFRGVQPVHVPAIWDLKVPHRVQFFLWLMFNNKTLTRDNLSKRRKVQDLNCLFCLEVEYVQHFFFDCAVAKQCWATISVAINVDLECSLVGIGKFWLSNKKHVVTNIITSTVLWCIWKLKNAFCFQFTEWRSMEILLYRICGVLQNWVVLCPQEKKEQLQDCIQKIKMEAMKTFWIPFREET